MSENEQDFQLLHEIAKQLSEKSKESSLSVEQIFDVFQDTFNKLTNAKVIELPLFVPVLVEQDREGFFIAESIAYSRLVKGIGQTESEAIEQFKVEIERYHRSCIEADRKTRIEKIISSMFPNQHL